MTNLSEVVGDLSVLTSGGKVVELRSEWQDHPVVLVLIRHFG